MTVRMLQYWNGHSPDDIVTGLSNEAALIAAGYATADLDGANNGRIDDAKLRTNADGSVSLVGSNGSIASKAFFNTRGVGIRVPFGRPGTISNATAKTFHVTAEMPGHFDGIAPIFLSQDAARSYQYAVVKMSVLSSVATDAELLNNSGTWSSVTMQGQAPIPIMLPRSGGSSLRLAYTTPDFLPLESIDRTDGGTLPLIACRAYINDTSATALPCYGNGSTDTNSNWATRSGGLWAARHINGDGVSTPTNFTGGTSATAQIQSPIIGFRFLSRGRVVTVCGVGDSIMEGRGTYIGEGYVLPACEAIQSETGLAISYFNAGIAGQTQMGGSGGITGYVARALDLLRNDLLRPDVMVMSIGSPNDETTTLTSAGIGLQHEGLQLVIAECKRRGVALVLTTWLPTNYAVYARGSTDALRSAYNTLASSKYPNVCDLAAIFDGGLDGNSQSIMLYTTDGIHPNDAGNALAKTALIPYLKSAIYGG